MAAVRTRQPFGVLDSCRLQKLTSVKNCQNAISASVSSPPSKQSLVSPGKRRLSVAAFDEAEDAENVDPAIFNSPSKRSKNCDGTPPVKPSHFILSTTPALKSASSAARKPVSLSVPTTTNTTPISASRGSPKHKRVGILSRGRRASSSPFRRINPPSFATPTGGLPFSIDEALKGSIPGYTGNAPVVEPAAPVLDVLPDTHMPKSWFFDIHEDTPEQEAANLMEHSASVLDISSDDDAVARRRDEEREKGKENMPPPEHLVSLPAGNGSTAGARLQQDVQAAAEGGRGGKKALHPDAMLEDRAALGELPAEDFCAAGPDAPSGIVITASGDAESGIKPSALSKEFDFTVPSPRGKLAAALRERGTAEGFDAQSQEIFICEDEV